MAIDKNQMFYDDGDVTAAGDVIKRPEANLNCGASTTGEWVNVCVTEDITGVLDFKLQSSADGVTFADVDFTTSSLPSGTVAGTVKSFILPLETKQYMQVILGTATAGKATVYYGERQDPRAV